MFIKFFEATTSSFAKAGNAWLSALPFVLAGLTCDLAADKMIVDFLPTVASRVIESTSGMTGLMRAADDAASTSDVFDGFA